MTPLPIDSILGPLVEAVRAHGAAVLRAETGAGKTTRVPGALLDAGLGPVVMLEPRRVAARAAARRIAYERGVRLGAEVGYHVRFDRKASDQTQLLVVTEGLLVRMLQDDPFLAAWGTVVIDEFHERSLQADLALAMVQRAREARSDLRVVVMSATIDPGPVGAFVGGPTLEGTGRVFPVDVRHAKFPDARPVEDQVAEAVRTALAETDGHVLAFLPGVREIHRTTERLASCGVRVVHLYGDLEPSEQDAVLDPGGARKIVLATNVAETSLTVPGVTAVVDGGWHRVLRRDVGTGLDRLETARISRANAEQRMGRAGRERPGICLRTWTEREHAGLDERLEPEVARVDLAGPVLELACWGEPDVFAFPWYEGPPADALSAAVALLRDLGAWDGAVTPLGRAMHKLPVHPRLARMVLEGQRLGDVVHTALAAAVLSERDGVRGPAQHRSESDVLDRLRQPSSTALKARDQLLASLGGRHDLRGPVDDDAVTRAVLAGFPDRVARMRPGEGRRALLVGGRGVKLDAKSAVDAPLFVAVDVDAGGRGALSEGIVRVASGVSADWLACDERVDVEFDAVNTRVSAVRRRRYRDLVLSEQIAQVPDDEAAAEVLAAAAGQRLTECLPAADDFRNALARLRWLADAMQELPRFDDDALRAVLPALCRGRRSFAELRRAPWIAALLEVLPWKVRESIDRFAPEQLTVPSGSQIRLAYEVGRAPVLAVRMQELFGLAESPRVADGRVKVVLHLLAPNGRPQQVTDDLSSFWHNTWPEVRRELRARYPKHAWPEDPWTAPPQRRPPRR